MKNIARININYKVVILLFQIELNIQNYCYINLFYKKSLKIILQNLKYNSL